METLHAWMKPDELRIIEKTVEEERRPTPRASPRVNRAMNTAEEAFAPSPAPLAGDLPSRAGIERDRKLKMKAAAPVRGRQQAERTTSASKVSAQNRVEQFLNHSLVARLGEVYCQACKRTLFNKWSSIDTHCKMGSEIKPSQHAKNLLAWNTRTDDDEELKRDLLAYYQQNPDEKAMTKDANEMAFRYRTTETFLASGTPLSRADVFRPLLQRSGYALTHSSHLTCYIPKIEKAETDLLKLELREQHIGISFDGTTRLGEAINTTARWCSANFNLEMRLVDFSTMEKHLNHGQFAIHVQDLIMRKLLVAPSDVINFSRDSVSLNGAACRLLTANPFTNACDFMCISHTLSNCGKHMQLATLDRFKTPWLELVGGRGAHAGAKKLWKETVKPQEVPGYSNVRWWAWAEITFVIAEAGMQRLGDFITECEQRDYGDATRKALRNIYDNETDDLRLQLAGMLDMRVLVATTMELEGDRLEIMLTYERIEMLRSTGRAIKSYADGCTPNIDATLRRIMTLKKGVVIEKYFAGHGVCTAKLVKQEKIDSTLSPGTEVQAWLVKYDSDGVEEHFEDLELRLSKDGPPPSNGDGKPVIVIRNLPERHAICDSLAKAFDYLEDRLTGNCEPQYDCTTMYEICRIVRAFDPNFALQHVDAAFVDSMAVLKPLVGFGLLPGMKAELPAYMAAAQHAPTFDKSDVSAYTDNLLKWWQTNGKSFPTWAAAARDAFALSPNSASCERVFSLLEAMFGDDQDSALADQVRATLMLRYNKRRVG